MNVILEKQFPKIDIVFCKVLKSIYQYKLNKKNNDSGAEGYRFATRV